MDKTYYLKSNDYKTFERALLQMQGVSLDNPNIIYQLCILQKEFSLPTYYLLDEGEFYCFQSGIKKHYMDIFHAFEGLEKRNIKPYAIQITEYVDNVYNPKAEKEIIEPLPKREKKNFVIEHYLQISGKQYYIDMSEKEITEGEDIYIHVVYDELKSFLSSRDYKRIVKPWIKKSNKYLIRGIKYNSWIAFDSICSSDEVILDRDAADPHQKYSSKNKAFQNLKNGMFNLSFTYQKFKECFKDEQWYNFKASENLFVYAVVLNKTKFKNKYNIESIMDLYGNYICEPDTCDLIEGKLIKKIIYLDE